MYQQIYDFGNSPRHQDNQQEDEDNASSEKRKSESVFYDQSNNQNHYNSPIPGTFTLRYAQFNSFDQQSQIHQTQSQQSNINYGQTQNNKNNDQHTIHNFNNFHNLSSPQDLVAGLTNTPVFGQIDIGQHNNTLVNTSNSPVNSLTTSVNILPPLNTTPIIVTPLQHHQNASHQTYLLAQKKPLKGSPRPSRERAPWTPEEDNLLKLAVQLYGDKTEKWAKIAACVPGRTNKNCRKRWFHSLDPSLRKGAWTEEEDQLLREGVSKFPNQWSKIAELLPGRTDDQCAKRWRESLDPSIDRSEWTPMEDNLLMEKYEEYGSQWQKIAYFFEGRPGLHCRNRWRKLQRMIQVKKEKEANLNTSFFNTLAEGQTLRFQNSNSTTLAPIPSKLTPLNLQNNTNHFGNNEHSLDNNNSLNTGDTSNSLKPQDNTNHHNKNNSNCNNNNNSNSNDNNHIAFQHLATLLPHHDIRPSSLSDSSVLGQFPNQTASTTEEYEYGYGVKPYGCDVPGCYAVFPASSGLFYHMKNNHPSLEGVAKPYRCAMTNCSKKYKNINGLQYHIKEAKGTTGHGGGIGLGEEDRPYRCSIGTCKKAYRTANGFRYHQQNGHNIQPVNSHSHTTTFKTEPIQINEQPNQQMIQNQLLQNNSLHHHPQPSQQEQSQQSQQQNQPQQNQQQPPQQNHQQQHQFRMKRERWMIEGV